MGQIVSAAAKPKRCNLNKLSQLETPAAGEHILVSSDNSMNAAGQGHFDSYIVGNGRDAATELPLQKFKAEELDEQINGKMITTETTEEIETLANKYINTNLESIPNSSTAKLNGTRCKVISVQEGDVFRIYGTGNTGAIRQWATAGSDKKYIRKSTTEDTRAIPAEVVIEAGEVYLGVNLYNYDSTTDKVVKVIRTTTRNPGMVDEISAIEQDVAEIKGTTITEYTPQALTADTYINMNLDLLPQQKSGTMEGVYSCVIFVEEGERYNIVGVGSSDALGLYAFTDEERNATYKSGELDTRNDGLVVTIPQGVARLYVNLCNYDSATDKVEKITTTQMGGYKGYTDEKVAEIANNKYPLLGKTIVCFGDSMTAFQGDYDGGKRWTDYFEDITGASVINVAIGGTRLCQRKISSSIITDPTATGYNSAMNLYSAIDIINMVRASCGMRFNDSFTYLELAQQFAQDINEDAVSAVDRLSNVDWNDVDGVIILGGANDWFSGNTHPGESGSKIGTSTLGAVNIIIESLLSTYKHLNIFWVTPYVTYYSSSRTSEDWCDNKVLNGMTGKQLISAIVNEVTLNHIPVCDLYNTLGWNEYNFSQYFRDTDNHHAYKGFRNIAEKIAAFIVCNKNL